MERVSKWKKKEKYKRKYKKVNVLLVIYYHKGKKL
jgi:hypothetical protein